MTESEVHMNKAFWKAALTRAFRTFCQSALALIPAAVTITAVDWPTVIGTAALAAVVSVLMSGVSGLPEVEDERD